MKDACMAAMVGALALCLTACGGPPPPPAPPPVQRGPPPRVLRVSSHTLQIRYEQEPKIDEVLLFARRFELQGLSDGVARLRLELNGTPLGTGKGKWPAARSLSYQDPAGLVDEPVTDGAFRFDHLLVRFTAALEVTVYGRKAEGMDGFPSRVRVELDHPALETVRHESPGGLVTEEITSRGRASVVLVDTEIPVQVEDYKLELAGLERLVATRTDMQIGASLPVIIYHFQELFAFRAAVDDVPYTLSARADFE